MSQSFPPADSPRSWQEPGAEAARKKAKLIERLTVIVPLVAVAIVFGAISLGKMGRAERLEELRASGIQPLVAYKFSATWCGPCRRLEQSIGKLEAEYAGLVRIQRVDVDSQPAMAAQYGIRSIPTIVLVRKGEEVGRGVGASLETYRNLFDRHLGR